jgi:curved DNA-binding protein CbpA
MSNHFARFGLTPSPWIDPELLKQRFLELSAAHHPDKATDKVAAEQEFQAVNQAYNILRNSRARLLHLLELHGRAKQEHVQNVPAEVMPFFMEVAAVTQRADALIKQKSAATSPMLKVQLMDQALNKTETIQNLQAKLRASINQIEGQLKLAANNFPATASASALDQLSHFAAALGFLERWSTQLQERIGALTF